MELENVGERFRQEFKTTAGRKFLGAIFHPTVTNSQAEGFQTPRRILRVSKATDFLLNQVVTTKAGRKYLCAHNGEGELDGLIYRTYRLFEMDQSFSWERRTNTTDTVTGLPKTSSFTSQGTILCAIEPLGDIKDQLQVPDPQYRLITNSAIQDQDRIDGRLTVKHVERLLGVYVADVS